MFTGIITDIGRVIDIQHAGDTHLRIGCHYDCSTIALGASIACDGICLTVTDRGGPAGDGWFTVTASQETLSKTTLGDWQTGRRLNLERALRLGDELGGHLVSGHVDGVARLIGQVAEQESLRMTFEAPAALAHFIAPKGSVALNGTSLTVNEVERNCFGVNLIPHTQEVTNWGDIREGALVNLEIDLLARYVARLAEALPARA